MKHLFSLRKSQCQRGRVVYLAKLGNDGVDIVHVDNYPLIGQVNRFVEDKVMVDWCDGNLSKHSVSELIDAEIYDDYGFDSYTREEWVRFDVEDYRQFIGECVVMKSNPALCTYVVKKLVIDNGNISLFLSRNRGDDTDLIDCATVYLSESIELLTFETGRPFGKFLKIRGEQTW